MKRIRWLVLGAVIALVVFLGARWKAVTDDGGQKPAEPFRIAGNLYYVGANDVTSFLLTGPKGHVLIDGGYPGTARLIEASIKQLGFDIRDVKVLLNSHAHFDHAGGLAALQKASGAELWISEPDADVVAAGGGSDPSLGPLAFLSWLPLLRYPAPHVDHRFKDGATVRVGPTALTAHLTPGHTPGCTTWSFDVRDEGRDFHVVSAGSLKPPLAMSLGEGPRIRAKLARSIRTLRGLPVDIWVTAHAQEFGRYRKFKARGEAKDPVEPFLDRAGYRAYVDSAEARLGH
jgi:metallo-beta-lactamase class B